MHVGGAQAPMDPEGNWGHGLGTSAGSPHSLRLTVGKCVSRLSFASPHPDGFSQPHIAYAENRTNAASKRRAPRLDLKTTAGEAGERKLIFAVLNG